MSILPQLDNIHTNCTKSGLGGINVAKLLTEVAQSALYKSSSPNSVPLSIAPSGFNDAYKRISLPVRESGIHISLTCIFREV